MSSIGGLSFEASLIVAAFILFTTLLVLLAFVANRRRQAQEEEMQRAASSRGWTFESIMERGFRVHRWTGSTEGVAWTAESLQRVSGGNKHQRRLHIARWHGGWTTGPAQPILFMGMPKGSEIPAFSVAQGEGFFAQMAQKAAGYAFDKAVDLYFGETIGRQVDATVMRRVNADMPGFIVMATDVHEGERFLGQGFERALVDASNDRGSLLSEKNRPWVLMRKEGVSLARMERFKDINEIDSFIHAGVRLTRASIFARPSFS
jgi:hypothetical protein